MREREIQRGREKAVVKVIGYVGVVPSGEREREIQRGREKDLVKTIGYVGVVLS